MKRTDLYFTVILPPGLDIPETNDNLTRIVETKDLAGGKTQLTIRVDEVVNVQLMKIVRVEGGE